MEREEENTETGEAPAKRYFVSCTGFDETPKGHLWRAMELTRNEEGEQKRNPVSGWMPKEEIIKAYPGLKRIGHGVCPSCKPKYLEEE